MVEEEETAAGWRSPEMMETGPNQHHVTNALNSEFVLFLIIRGPSVNSDKTRHQPEFFEVYLDIFWHFLAFYKPKNQVIVGFVSSTNLLNDLTDDRDIDLRDQ